MSTVEIYDRRNGRTKTVTPEKAREMRASSPGVYADSRHTPVTEADWSKMTSGERLATSFQATRPDKP